MLVYIVVFLALMLCFGGFRYVYGRRMAKTLGTAIFIPSKGCRRKETISSAVGTCIWVGLFVYCLISGEGLSEGKSLSMVYVIVMGFMGGMSLSSLTITALIPTGLYEKGILTETRAVTYQEVSGYTVEGINGRNIKKITFTPVANKDKKLILVVSDAETKKVLQKLKTQNVYLK